MRAFLHDLRIAVRGLLTRPGFAIATTLSLAIGIGANALVFSVVDGLVLHPYPYPELDRLVGVGSAFPRLNRDLGYYEVHSAPEFADIRSESRTLEHVVAFDIGNRQVAGEEAPTNVLTAFWWGDGFSAMALSPALGRGFREDEIRRQERVAVISHRMWQSRFGGDPDILGGKLLVNGEPYGVIGVMPPSVLIFGTDLWLPMWAAPEHFPRERRQLQVMGRIAPGATLAAVNAELETIARRTEARFAVEHEEYLGWRLQAGTWPDISSSLYRPAGTILLGAVGFVLLLVLANVANLVLVRAGTRRQELAIRTALGAARGRLIQHLMAEHLLLAVAGGALGIGLATTMLPLVEATIPIGLPTGAELAINGRVLVFVTLLSLGAALVFGLLPTLLGSRLDPQRVLRTDAGHATANRGALRLQRVLVAVEVTLAMCLLAGAGLLAKSFITLRQVDPGFDPGRALTFRMTLPYERYSDDGLRPFFLEVVRRVAAIPGVERASLASQLPPGVFAHQELDIEGVETLSGGALPSAFLTLVSPNYFETMGIPLLHGRTLDARDRPESSMAAVVNAAAARRFFPGREAIGHRFRLAGDGDPGAWIEIVGVVRDVRNRGLDAEPAPEIYGSTDQVPLGNQLHLVARTAGDPTTILPAVRAAVAGIDPDLPVYAIQTLDEAYANSMAQERLAAGALTAFAGLALALAAMGIYGIVSHGASSRTREIGVRMALGARRAEVLRLVVRQALVPVAVGFGLGLAGAVVLSRLLREIMFEVSPNDPATLVSMAAVLFAAAGLACYLPARRASRLDPVTALHHE